MGFMSHKQLNSNKDDTHIKTVLDFNDCPYVLDKWKLFKDNLSDHGTCPMTSKENIINISIG